MAIFTIANIVAGAVSTFVGSLGAPGKILIKSSKEEKKNDSR